MPRSEWERSPGPFTAADRVVRVDFCFGGEGWRQLLDLLVKASPELNHPCAPPSPENAAELAAAGRFVPCTPAERIIAAAEEQARLLLSARKADPKAVPGNPANYRAAIRRLVQALKPFVSGSIDAKTTEIADWGAIEAALIKRDAELTAIKRPTPYQRRELQHNCGLIADATKEHARSAGVELSEDTVLSFVHAAIYLADIELPDPKHHLDRLRKLVFG
jgi:hypothetical protein